MANIPNWRKNFPANVGTPSHAKPYKCWACATPVWIWNGYTWVCYNCKLHAIIANREQLDEKTLEGCMPTGVYPRYREIDEFYQ